jgi:ferrous iron transport protein A
VQQERFGLAVVRDAVEAQRVVGAAERAGDDRLRLAAREQRRAVRARQQADLAPDRPDLRRRAAVEPLAAAERQFARLGPHRVAERAARARLFLGGQRSEPGGLGGGDRGAARRLLDGLQRCAQFGARRLGQRRLRRRGGDRELGLAGRGAQFGERLLAARDPLGRLQDRRDRVVLADLARFAFEHHESVGSDADRELEVRELALGLAAEREPLAVHTLDAQAAGGALGRHRTDVQRGAGGEDREALEVARRFGAEHLHLDLHFVAELVGEQRADRAIDQPAGQHFVVGDAPFAAAEAAGYAARRGELLAVLDGQRKEVLAGLRRGRGRHGREHAVVAAAREHRAVGLARDASGLERDLRAGDLDGGAVGGGRHGQDLARVRRPPPRLAATRLRTSRTCAARPRGARWSILRSSLKNDETVSFRAEPDPGSDVPEPEARGTAPVASLAEARVGQVLEVREVAGDDALAHRLRASGLWPGTLVEVLGRAPFGDPLLFRLHGFRLALRRNEAARVTGSVVESRA